MEASIGMHYHVIVSITAAIFSLLLVVFMTVFCSCCSKQDRESLESQYTETAGEKQPLLGDTTQSGCERVEPHQDEIGKDKTRHSAQSDSGIVTGTEHLDSGPANTSDVSDKSQATEKKSKNGEPGSTCVQVKPSSTKVHSEQQDNNDAPKVCSEPQNDSAGAHHHDSSKIMATDQEKVKSKDVALRMLVSNEDCLTSDDIQKVREKIWEARVKWYHIGIELGISVDDLGAIKNGATCHDINECITDMLVIWLRRTDATWEALARALRSKPVGYPQLADLITSNESASAEPSVQGCETTVSDSTTEGVMAFNCGCPTPCRLIDHLNGKCPSSLKLFPYLDFSKLTKKEQFDLKAKLCRETTAIITEFANLTKHMRKSLVDQHLHPKEIISSVLGIAPSKSSTCPILETLHVESVTSIYDVIIHLQQNSYISFFNYHIVEYLINEYGTDEEKAELDKYITHFQDFCRRSVFEVPQHIHGQPPKDSIQLAIKVISKNQFSLGDAKNVQIKVAEVLGLQNCASLPLFETSKGCVMLTFALPKLIIELIKPKLGPDGIPTNIDRGTDEYSIHILCGPPGKPFVTNVTTDSVTLQWIKPEYVGTISLTHYNIYYRLDTGPWEKNKFTLTNGLKESVTVEDLSHKDGAASFVFKVEAVSKVGVIRVESKESDPIQLSTPLSELKLRLDLDWKKKTAMPFGISVYPPVAILKEKVYIGGGNTPSDTERHTVLVYHPQEDTYDKLPPYTHKYFAIAVIDDNLVLIGGEQDDKLKPRFTNQLGVWDRESLKWTHPLPPMSTPCKCPSVTTYENRWLVVIGGYNSTDGALSRVEILDISSRQWFNSAPMLVPCHQVSLATIGNMCYFMGGLIDNTIFSKRVYAVRIDRLISQNSNTLSIQSPWSTLPDTPGTQATAVALNGALLAVGGMGADFYMYQPSTKSWENIGRLRIGRSACACVILSSGEVLVAGGGEMKVAGDTGTIDHSHNTDQKVDIGTLCTLNY